nr:tyrosine-type recombinase/integrase [Saccharothrix carnea]
MRYGKGAKGSGPRERMVPLINGADRTLRWYVEDVWGQFEDDHTRQGAPLFPSERRSGGAGRRLGKSSLRGALSEATRAHLPGWAGGLTPHVLRHFCASQLYLSGMGLVAIRETLGHAWVATTMRYVHVHRDHVEQAWLAGQALGVPCPARRSPQHPPEVGVGIGRLHLPQRPAEPFAYLLEVGDLAADRVVRHARRRTRQHSLVSKSASSPPRSRAAARHPHPARLTAPTRTPRLHANRDHLNKTEIGS